MAIIFLDDDDKTRSIFRKAFEGLGAKVHFPRDVDETLKFAKENETHAFILDINLGPGRELEGLDVLEKIRSIPGGEHPFVAMLSAYSGRYGRIATRLGADKFVEKTGNALEDIKSILEHRKVQESFIEDARSVTDVLQSLRAEFGVSWEELDETLNGTCQ